MSDAAPTLVLNGVDGTTGGYLTPPITTRRLAAAAAGEERDEERIGALRAWLRRVTGLHLGPVEDVDPKSLAQSGWGVVFSRDADPGIREALGELLDHRRREAASESEGRYREFTGDDGYHPGESKVAFLGRHGAGPGAADPDRVPYYLLLVGGPEEIPYAFQYQLAVQYAVGRLHLGGPEDYARYARAVVETETGAATPCRDVALFGVRNDDDPTTGYGVDHLLRPLADALARKRPDRVVHQVLDHDATKERLAELVGGARTPALLMTTSHGMGFPPGDRRQLAHQGALLCADWPGPVAWRRAIPEDHYFAAGDLDGDARLSGLVSFHYACYGGGTPRDDDALFRATGERKEIAPSAFVAGLPRRLLVQGALAVVGHVGRAWGYSYVWPSAGPQPQTFVSAFKRLLDGHPVGSAMDPFPRRYAELACDLAAVLEDVDFGKQADDDLLAGLWTARNDVRSYVVLGDPAVRLAA